MGKRGRVPLRVRAAERRRIDRRASGGPAEHEQLVEGRRDDSPGHDARIAKRVHARVGHERTGVPNAIGDRRHDDLDGRADQGGAVVGATRSSREHVHRLSICGRHHLDARRQLDDRDDVDGVRRSRRCEPQPRRDDDRHD